MLSIASVSGAATEETRSLGGFGSVLIYTPTKLSPLGGRSLMIVLHGCTQKPVDFRNANLQISADKSGAVIAVPEAMYKAGYGCWDYWSATPNRNLKDYKNLISLAKTMVEDPQYKIDSKQVYLVGLSSGGVFAMNTACLAPDVFAGMGLVGSASAGTPASAAIVTIEGTKKLTQQKCESFAGTSKPHFQTQITVSVYGTKDYTVDQKYGPQNASAMALVYGHSDVSINADIPKAKIKVNPEKTVSLVELTNEGHTWPGGLGASGAYIGNASINIATYLGEFFNANNRRVTAPDPAPEQPVDLRVDEVTETTVTLSITDPNNPKIVKYRVLTLNLGDVLGEPVAAVVNGRAILKLTGLQANAHYQIEVIAIDSKDQESMASAPISFTLLAPPPPKYTVTAEVIGQGGQIAPTEQEVFSGARVTFEVTASDGYTIGPVMGCSGLLTGSTYTISEVTGNCTVIAQFNAVAPEPSPNPNPNPTPTPTPTPKPTPNPEKSSGGGSIPLCLLFFMPALLIMKVFSGLIQRVMLKTYKVLKQAMETSKWSVGSRQAKKKLSETESALFAPAAGALY